MGGPDTTGVVRGGGLVLHGALSLQTPVYIYIYIYGLEMVHLPHFLFNKLNALQLKGLRKILHMDTTFVNRANSNNRVIETANSIKNPKNLPNKNILPFGTYIKNKQASALTQNIRANNTDPLRQTALRPDTPFIVGEEHRRVARPRHKAYVK